MKLCYFLAALVSLVVSQQPVNVTTTYGVLEGLSFENYQVWRGIPYAKPPVGALRFQSPVEIDAWAPAVYPANQFKAGCMQKCDLPPHVCPQMISEDCLYIDVFAPSQASMQATPGKKKVMVFIPGGAFMQGAGNVALYRGNVIVNQTDIILVDVNYRLGVFGSLVYEEHGQYASKGNFGLEDQRMVLKWVQKNIAAFGGDPNDVTLFGQSAGAMSTSIHLISPLSQGLFHKVIMESNPLALPYKKQSYQKHWGNSFARHLGCRTFACMQSKPADAVLKAQLSTFFLSLKDLWDMMLLWTPTIDGYDFPEPPLNAFKAGRAAKVPVVIGTVQNEGLIFVKKAVSYVSKVEYDALMVALFGPINGIRVDILYPPRSVAGKNKTMVASHVITDYAFRCATRKATEYLSKINNGQVYLYRFNHALSFAKQSWGPNYQYCDPYTCHGGELPFVFNPVALVGVQFTPQEAKLSAAMQAYWTNFAKTGSPNGPMAVPMTWPVSVNGTDSVNLLLTAPQISVNTNYNAHMCQFWDKMYP